MSLSWNASRLIGDNPGYPSCIVPILYIIKYHVCLFLCNSVTVGPNYLKKIPKQSGSAVGLMVRDG